MDLNKRKTAVAHFFNSQFHYCFVTSMFHNWDLNNILNRLHERCLRFICNDKIMMIFKTENLLHKDCSISIHRRTIHTLIIEMYKVINGPCPEIIKKNFPLREDNYCNLRQAFQIIVAHINWKLICLLYSADNLGINTFWINSKEPIKYAVDFI